MKRYSKLIIALVITSSIVGLIVLAVWVSDVPPAHITDFEYSAVVVDEQGGNGKIVITERITYKITAATQYDAVWELWRDLPEERVDGVLVEYNVLSVKRIAVNGEPSVLEFQPARELYKYDYQFDSTSIGLGPDRWFHSAGPYDGENYYECVLFYVNGLKKQTIEFELKYEMLNASMRYGDCSELYVSMYADSTVSKLNSFKGEIMFPNDKLPSKQNRIVNTFGTRDYVFDFEESATRNEGYYTFFFELDKKRLRFTPSTSYLEFSLVSKGEDKHIFTQYASVNNQYNSNILSAIEYEQQKYLDTPSVTHARSIKLVGQMCIFVAIMVGAVAGIGLLAEYLAGIKRPKVRYHFYRELPSKLDVTTAGMLVFCKHTDSNEVSGAFAATILSLIKKGLIEVVRIDEAGRWTVANSKIVLFAATADVVEQKKKLEYTTSERQYYKLICKHAKLGEIGMQEFQKCLRRDYMSTGAAVEEVEKKAKQQLVDEGYVKDAKYKQPLGTAVSLGCFMVVAGVIITAIASFVSYNSDLGLAYGAYFIMLAGFLLGAATMVFLSGRRVRLTQHGQDEYAKWRGFYNFLKSATLINERTVMDIEIWEEYLIYATAFGISDRVVKALKVNMPDHDVQISHIARHPFVCTTHFTRVYSRSVGTTARVATHSSRVGGGGSYGGGGRGGGGGGGGS